MSIISQLSEGDSSFSANRISTSRQNIPRAPPAIQFNPPTKPSTYPNPALPIMHVPSRKRPRKRPRTLSPTSSHITSLTPSAQHNTATYLSTLPSRATTAYDSGHNEQALHLCTFALTQPDLPLEVRSQLVDTLAAIYLERLEVLADEAVELGKKIRGQGGEREGLRGDESVNGSAVVVREVGGEVEGMALDEEEEPVEDIDNGLEGESDGDDEEGESASEDGYELWTGDEESDGQGMPGSGDGESTDRLSFLDEESDHSIGLVEREDCGSHAVDEKGASSTGKVPLMIEDTEQAFDDVEAAWALFDEAVVEVSREPKLTVSVHELSSTIGLQRDGLGMVADNDIEMTTVESPSMIHGPRDGTLTTKAAEIYQGIVAAKEMSLLSPVSELCPAPSTPCLAESSTGEGSDQHIDAVVERGEQKSTEHEVLPPQNNISATVAAITIPRNGNNLTPVQEPDTDPFEDSEEPESIESYFKEQSLVIHESGNQHPDNDQEEAASIDGETMTSTKATQPDPNHDETDPGCQSALEPATAQSEIEDLDKTLCSTLSKRRLEISTLATPSIPPSYKQAATPKSSTLLGWSSPAVDRYRAILAECKAMRKEYDQELESNGCGRDGVIGGNEAVGEDRTVDAFDVRYEGEFEGEIEEQLNREDVAGVDGEVADGDASPVDGWPMPIVADEG